MNRFDGRICLVTGAARGIGKGIAKRLLDEGAQVWNEMSAEAGLDAAYWDLLRAHTALGRLGDPADIAAGVAYLACDDAAFVTGHVMVVDGGLTARQLVLPGESTPTKPAG